MSETLRILFLIVIGFPGLLITIPLMFLISWWDAKNGVPTSGGSGMLGLFLLSSLFFGAIAWFILGVYLLVQVI